MSSEYFFPYQKRIFWLQIFISLTLSAIIGVGAYVFYSNMVFRDAQNELKNIAYRTAAFIPMDMHETIITTDDDKTENYRILSLYLKSVRAGNSLIDDIYTLRTTNQPDRMTFVLSAMDTADYDKDGVLEENEIKPAVGEAYDIADLPALKNGLEQTSVDAEITFDKWGAWLSGYAPLIDSQGKTVGLIGVDFPAENITQERRELGRIIFLSLVGINIVMVLLIYSLSRYLSGPFRILGEGMQRVARGDLSYRLPERGKSEIKYFTHLFNKMADTFSRTRHDELHRHFSEKDSQDIK